MIYYVEDDANVRELALYALAQSGLQAKGFPEAEPFYEACKETVPDLILLDIMLPHTDGLTILRELRHDPSLANVPVMMLTAKGEKNDRITGFNAGADDYLPKPFDPDELLSRVRAILRRSESYQPTVLAYGDLTLDPGSGNLRCGRETIRLSGREFQIMELFLRSPRQVFSAERIMERVWGWDNDAEINVVWVNISNLRKKLRAIGSHVTLQANRGLGYALEESV